MSISFPKPGEAVGLSTSAPKRFSVLLHRSIILWATLYSAHKGLAAHLPPATEYTKIQVLCVQGDKSSITPQLLAEKAVSSTTATTTTTQTLLSLNTTVSTTGTSTLTTATPTTLSSVNEATKAIPPSPVTFAQLEENINKWTIELEEQEKVFMNQVAHINEWDRLLLANGDKIVTLNSKVEKVKLEQQQLDHELDFIVAQQRELEECLLPLEKELADVNVSDPERDATYRMAESLKTQLRQMSEDLKEVIEHINEKNKHQDSSDPIVQIGRILNAHMNSLQWVDQNTTLIKQQLDQVTQLTEMHRRENGTTQNL